MPARTVLGIVCEDLGNQRNRGLSRYSGAVNTIVSVKRLFELIWTDIKRQWQSEDRKEDSMASDDEQDLVSGEDKDEVSDTDVGFFCPGCRS
jgi:hypothetical protein